MIEATHLPSIVHDLGYVVFRVDLVFGISSLRQLGERFQMQGP